MERTLAYALGSALVPLRMCREPLTIFPVLSLCMCLLCVCNCPIARPRTSRACTHAAGFQTGRLAMHESGLHVVMSNPARRARSAARVRRGTAAA